MSVAWKTFAFLLESIKFQTRLQDTVVVKIQYTIYEPVHEISNNSVCATSKASDQPAHMRSLIRAFISSLSIL